MEHAALSLRPFRCMRLVVAVALLSLVALPSFAQPRTFEVVSVLSSAPDQNGSFCRFDLPAAAQCGNMPLRDIISIAYDLGRASLLNDDGMFRLVGGPNDLLSRPFDIQGRTSADASIADKKEMLRAVLRDRFALRIRPEIRQVPIFAVTRDGKDLGPGLKPTTVDCASAEMRARRAANEPTPCGVLRSELAGGIRIARSVGTMQAFARSVQSQLGRPVIDQTGLTGTFAWSARYRSDNSNIDAPVFVDAIRQELGLRIVPKTGPYEVMVIDSVAPPTSN
jgi:uncharacterized protein (TIGR03435 family)